MIRTTRRNWHDPAMLASGMVQALTVPIWMVSFGRPTATLVSWFVCVVWTLGIAVCGSSVRAGSKLGWRHAFAMIPGLCSVHAFPKVPAMLALAGLGVVLLMASRRKDAESVRIEA